MSDSLNIPSVLDAFGNEIDSSVGYARGRILRSSEDEVLRLQHCRELSSQRVATHGINSIGIFTGNRLFSPLEATDVSSFCDEWIGTYLIENQFQAAALDHLGGGIEDEVFLFNRASAALICAISALSESSSVISIVPANSRSHPSIGRGCTNSRVSYIEVAITENWRSLLPNIAPKLVIVTAVTSKQEALTDDEINEISELTHAVGGTVLLDDAYGARIRPALNGGALSLHLNVDLAVTNCDKAGLHGPRAGLLGGRRHLVAKLSTLALEWGMEARAPARVAALRALQRYSHQDFSAQAELGQALTRELRKKFPADLVSPTALGPLLSEETLLGYMIRRREKKSGVVSVVPCEAMAALAILLLRDNGIVTINTHGQPGASVTLRLKPTNEGLTNVGGMLAVAEALDSAIFQVSEHLEQEKFFSELIFGT